MLRQQHLFSNWGMDVLEKQFNVLWQKMYGSKGGGGGTWTPNLMTNSLPIEIWTIKTRCVLHHFYNTDYGEKRYSGYLFVVLIFKMIPVHWQRHFILTNVEWMILRIFFFFDNFFFLWQKCLNSRRVSPQNLRIHAECSAICSGFWPILVPDRIKSVQNTLSQRTELVILWSAACNPILHIFTGTYKWDHNSAHGLVTGLLCYMCYE